MLRLSRYVAASIVLASGLVRPDVATTQDSYTLGRPTFENSRVLSIGYVASAPSTLYGGGVAFLNPSFLGVYADFKLSGASPAGNSSFNPSWTPDDALNEFGDFRVSEEDEWMVFNAAFTRVLGPELAIYAGGGIARRRAFFQFEDPSHERGEFGYYWVEDPDLSGTYVNGLAGVFFRAGKHLLFQLGAEAQPRGMTVGVHYALPLR